MCGCEDGGSDAGRRHRDAWPEGRMRCQGHHGLSEMEQELSPPHSDKGLQDCQGSFIAGRIGTFGVHGGWGCWGALADVLLHRGSSVSVGRVQECWSASWSLNWEWEASWLGEPRHCPSHMGWCPPGSASQGVGPHPAGATMGDSGVDL